MAYHSFQDLEVWKLSVDVSVEIYSLFRTCKDFGLKDQICRASVSVPSNIAEGLERDSIKETIHFLHIAKGSAAELRTQLLISVRIGYISEQTYHEIIIKAESISKMLHSLIQSFRKKL